MTPTTRPLAVLVLLSSLAGASAAGELAPFTSDGCSSFPNGTPQQSQLWADCCIAHDLAYWRGGSETQRLTADQALEACVRAKGESEVATLMLKGVRVGGSPYFPTPYRWGYGWPFPRGYQPLSEAEKAQARARLQVLGALIEAAERDLETAPEIPAQR